jgi:exodeoxyribonuclease V gamma subunit
VDDPLDMRRSQRRAGDVTPRERDRYAFLELLLATRERLILSYVSRDPATGEPLGASSVVDELLHSIETELGTGTASLRRSHALRRWDARYFPDLFPRPGRATGTLVPVSIPEAHAEARALALRWDAESHGATTTIEEVMAKAARDPSWAMLAENLALAPLPDEAPPVGARTFVPIHALVKFLEFPLQAWARFRLGLDERADDDAIWQEDEPFETHFRDETLFLRDVLLDARRAGRPLAEVYDGAVRDRELRGEGPSGPFARGERSAHLETLETWSGAMKAHSISSDTLEVHRLGRAGERSRADHVHDALSLDVDVVDGSGIARVLRVEVGGRLLPLAASSETSVTLAKRAEQTDRWSQAGRERAALRAFVDHAVLSATGVAHDRPHASLSVVATPEGSVVDQVRFAALSRDEATVWLRNLARDLLSEQHAYFLPCEAVIVRARHDPDGSLAARIEEARDKLSDADGSFELRSVYGPVPRPQDYPAPDERIANEMVERRFGLFFDKREEES